MSLAQAVSPQKIRAAEGVPVIVLPEPTLGSPVTVGEALRRRRTIRQVTSEKLPLCVLSDLLWAACGVNRPEGPFGLPGRTDASASNSQEIVVYAALEEGIYLYEPTPHHLTRVVEGDFRGLAIGPRQAHAGDQAAVRLIYVADVRKLEHSAGPDEPGLHDPEVQKAYYHVACGMIAAHVYLYAASMGLAAWFHNCDRSAVAKKLPLRAGRRVLFAQTVGYIKESPEAPTP
jgi:nitroreductase